MNISISHPETDFRKINIDANPWTKHSTNTQVKVQLKSSASQIKPGPKVPPYPYRATARCRRFTCNRSCSSSHHTIPHVPVDLGRGFRFPAKDTCKLYHNLHRDRSFLLRYCGERRRTTSILHLEPAVAKPSHQWSIYEPRSGGRAGPTRFKSPLLRAGLRREQLCVSA